MNLIKKSLAISVSLALCLSACSPNKTVDEYIVDAKASINNNQEKNAIIELKNAIRSDLKNPEARFLLGSIYLKQGNAAEAEKELKKALSLKFNIEKVLPKLIKALNLQDKSKEVLSIIDEHSLIAQKSPEILLYQAISYNRLGKKQEAKQAIEQANDLSAQSVYSQLGEAYLKILSADVEDALVLIDKILDKSPNFTDAILLKGLLNGYLKNYPDAIKSYQQYFKLAPNDTKIRLFLADAYVKNEQFKEANLQLDYLLKIAPEQPFINQLKGLVYYQQNNYKQALYHTQKAIQNGLNTNSNRVIAGLSAFKLKQYELAHQLLVTVVKDLPKNHPVRKVLAIVQLQLGYGDEASDTLADIDNLTSEDVNLITSASFELLKEGKTKQAQALINKTNKIVTDNPEDQTNIGILKLSMNDLEGITDLEKAIEIDPELPLAKMALAAAYIQNKEYDKALSLAEKWKNDNPKAVEGYNLAAKVLLLQNKMDEAEVELNKVLSFNENSSYTLIYFANKHLLNGKPKEAIKLLDKIFSVAPSNIIALKLNYRAHKALGEEQIAIDRIKKSFEDNLTNMAYRLLYAKVMFIEKNFTQTINLLKNIENDKTVPTTQWIFLGDSYLQNQQIKEALAVYNQWLKVQPQLRVAWLRKITAQEKLNDVKGALLTVEEAINKAPKDKQFKILRVYYQIENKQFKEAQSQLDKLTDKEKALPLTQGLQAKIWLTESKFKKAVPGLKKLYKIMPTPYNAALLFSSLKKIHQDKEAFAFIQKHVNKYPNDLIAINLLAESAIQYNKPLASELYVKLLSRAPENVSILNNLAWVEYELENYKSADEYVTKALKLKPTHPQILDTAGLIKFKLGNKKVAEKLLKQAVSLAPKDEKIAEHYKMVISAL